MQAADIVARDGGRGGGPTPDAVAHVALRIGRIMLVDGAETESARRTVAMVVAAFGYEAHLLITAEALLVTVQGPAGFRTKVGSRIAAMAADMDRLVRVAHLVDEIETGRSSCVDADTRLDAIEATAGGHPLLLVMAGMAVTAGSLVRLFGGDWPVAAAAALAGALGTVLRRAFAAARINPIAAAFLTAFLSGLAAALAIRAAPGASPTLCLVAAGMILVPGVPLINGVRDLVEGHAANAVVRLALAAATVLAIGFALFLAAAIAADRLPVEGSTVLLPIAEDFLFSALAAAGYSTLFNVPLHAVWACIVCGMASHGLRTALQHAGLDLATASLIGAAAAALVARPCAHAYRVPPVTFAFPGVVAMIPGAFAFRAGIGGLELTRLGGHAPPDLVATTLSLIITTMLVTAAVAIGVTLALSIGARSADDRLRSRPATGEPA